MEQDGMTGRRRIAVALAVSAMLHAVLLLMLTDPPFVGRPAEPTALEVELVPKAPPPPKKPAEEPKPEPPKPEPAKAKPPEPPKPDPKPEPPKPEPPKPPPPPLRPEPPQLQKGKVADKSSAPDKGRGGGPGDVIAATRDPAGGGKVTLSTEAPGKGTKARTSIKGDLAQSEADFILAQIVRYWRYDRSQVRGMGLVMGMEINIHPDGTLSPPLHKNSPWSPQAAVPGYDRLSPPLRALVDSMIVAIRMAQPLELPTGRTWPRRLSITFAIDDI